MRHGEPLYIRLLGGFSVSVGGQVVKDGAWRLKKAKALVKMLAFAPGHRLHRERVMDVLWPRLGAVPAANNLHNALHAARRAIGDSGCLRLDGDLLSLCPEASLRVDVEEFEAAAKEARRVRTVGAYREALEVYAGDLLPEDLYEEWAEERRAELRRTHLELLVELACLEEESGNLPEAIAALRKAVGKEPLHEEANAALMRVYARAGWLAEVVKQYRRLEEELRRRLGAEPGSEIRSVYQEVLDGKHSPARTPPAEVRRHNLSSPLTSFVGREREMEEVRELLAATRFLTLTGPGGSGKTRLALEVGRSLVAEFGDGVWMVELAPLSEEALVPKAVAEVLSVREQGNRPFVEALADELRAKEALLVLDNCEHLVRAAARLSETLLGSCPRLRILATSRVFLGVPGEIHHPVPSLSMPDPGSAAERLAGFESVRLFVDRVSHRLPGFFSLTEENARAVGEVCRGLDGVPLAIELAAAWAGVLTVAQISERLDDALGLLTLGGRTAEPRQRTLRAAMDWSHELLDAPERKLFAWLSVFAGGFTLEAVEEVGDGIGRILAVLSRLVDKSLVAAEASPGTEGEPRYRMLEPVRQYARERLEARGEADELRERHASYYLALAERAEPELRGPLRMVWLDRLEAEHDNLRAVLGWSLGRGEVEAAVRLGWALQWFWWIRAHLDEGRRWMEEALAKSYALATPVRARTLFLVGFVAQHLGDHRRAIPALQESLELYRETGDSRGTAWSLERLGWSKLSEGEHGRAASFFGESLSLFREMDDEQGSALVLTGLGWVRLEQGDHEQAMRLHEESLALFSRVGDTGGVALVRANLGHAALLFGDPAQAKMLFEESLTLFREVEEALLLTSPLHGLGWVALEQGDAGKAALLFRENLSLFEETKDKWSLGDGLEGLAGVAGALGEAERSARLWGTADALREAIGVPIWAPDRTIHERHRAAVRSRLHEAEWTAAWSEGWSMMPREAVEYALREEAPASRKPPRAGLTRREREAAVLAASGLTNRQIAEELNLSKRTVDNHVGNILKKLGLDSRKQLSARMIERN